MLRGQQRENEVSLLILLNVPKPGQLHIQNIFILIMFKWKAAEILVFGGGFLLFFLNQMGFFSIF